MVCEYNSPRFPEMKKQYKLCTDDVSEIVSYYKTNAPYNFKLYCHVRVRGHLQYSRCFPVSGHHAGNQDAYWLKA